MAANGGRNKTAKPPPELMKAWTTAPVVEEAPEVPEIEEAPEVPEDAATPPTPRHRYRRR
jgi:hypothetical protein